MTMIWVWVKTKTPEKLQVLVNLSIYQGSILGAFFGPRPFGLEIRRVCCHVASRPMAIASLCLACAAREEEEAPGGPVKLALGCLNDSLRCEG